MHFDQSLLTTIDLADVFRSIWIDWDIIWCDVRKLDRFPLEQVAFVAQRYEQYQFVAWDARHFPGFPSQSLRGVLLSVPIIENRFKLMKLLSDLEQAQSSGQHPTRSDSLIFYNISIADIYVALIEAEERNQPWAH